MKLGVDEDLNIVLREVFNSVVLKTSSNETMAICMRDSGFEFKYQGVWYEAKEGVVQKMIVSTELPFADQNGIKEENHD